ncbi:hypothetical protein QVD17_38650 [Tagetes erecta]|uniref:Uncharacterized protein n=1 Tax=Tagetes erecta TaxID=13708 RepID=A0AAD8N9I5_TARER|nr:hypothetical protein QVD17_38650 [Tagetes erecta]
MGEQDVVISAPSAPPSTAPKPPPQLAYIFVVLLGRTVFLICMIAYLGVIATEHASAFENNKVFQKTSLAAFCTVLAVGVITFCFCDISIPMNNIFYNTLKFIGCFAAFLAPFSLLMLLLLPPKLNWIGYCVVCFMFGMLVTCFYLDNKRQDKISPAFDLTLTFFVPILLMLATFSPQSICPKLLNPEPTQVVVPLSVTSKSYALVVAADGMVFRMNAQANSEVNMDPINF